MTNCSKRKVGKTNYSKNLYFVMDSYRFYCVMGSHKFYCVMG